MTFVYSQQRLYILKAFCKFYTGLVQGIILGGWYDYFGKCTVPNNVLLNKTSSSVQVPVTLGVGTYRLYCLTRHQARLPMEGFRLLTIRLSAAVLLKFDSRCFVYGRRRSIFLYPASHGIR